MLANRKKVGWLCSWSKEEKIFSKVKFPLVFYDLLRAKHSQSQKMWNTCKNTTICFFFLLSHIHTWPYVSMHFVWVEPLFKQYKGQEVQCGIVGDLITLSQQVIGKLAEEIIKTELYEEKQTKWAHFCSFCGTKIKPPLLYFYISYRCSGVANNSLKSASIKRSELAWHNEKSGL